MDTEALTAALENGEINFAALDVTDPEPLPRNHKLLNLKNCIVTGHICSATRNSRIAMFQLAIDNVIAAANSLPLPTEVPESMSIVGK